MSKHDDYLDPDRAGLFDETEDNLIVEAAFADYAGLYDLYRSTYKYTACGPSVGATLRYWQEPAAPAEPDDPGREVTKTFYCDDLRQWGTWRDLQDAGAVVVAIGASSIVEGVDWEVPWREIDCDADSLAAAAREGEEPHETLARLYWELIEEVNAEAEAFWNDSHGCETCQEHWQEFGFKNGENEYGYVTVWDECPDCGGHGTVI